MPAVAAIAFACVTAIVVAFEVALALGAPWGAYAMGGARPGRFSAPMRASAIGQAVVLAFLAVIVLADAGLGLPTLSSFFVDVAELRGGFPQRRICGNQRRRLRSSPGWPYRRERLASAAWRPSQGPSATRTRGQARWRPVRACGRS